MIQIKPLEINQIKAFVEVHLKCWEETYMGIFPAEVIESRRQKQGEREQHILRRLQEDSNYFYYCLYDDFQIVGILIFSILDGVGVLDAIYIRKEYQRKGYGMSFIQIMESILKERNIEKYSVYVFQLLNSQAFFEHIGCVAGSLEYISIHGIDYMEREYVKKVGEL